MAERRKRKEEAAEPGAPAWMVTYGDLMGLMLTFFVLLLSFSTINEEEFKEALKSLQGALGVLPRNLSVIDVNNAVQRAPRSPRAASRMAMELRRRMQILGMDEQVDVELDNERGGLRINLPGHILFETASDLLRPEAYAILGDIGDVLATVPEASVEIRGHTDSRPLRNHPRFADNWDLSYHRAKSVMEYLSSSAQLDPGRLEAVACGPTQPIATNDTPEGQQANRRVELFVRGEFSEETRESLHQGLGESFPKDEFDSMVDGLEPMLKPGE